MECKHFKECGSCTKEDYDLQLEDKKEYIKELFNPFYNKEIEVFNSPKKNYRARAEFRVWHKENSCFYAMSSKDGIVLIKECPMPIKPIENRMWILLEKINKIEILKHKLFAIEFLASTIDEVLVTLIYHKKLTDEWIEEIKPLEKELNIFIIGRSRKQKVVLSQEFITEKLEIENREFIYKHYEGGFTQPNPFVNIKMVKWAKKLLEENQDLLELYCGLGNFTIPLSTKTRKTLATEISKNSIKAGKENLNLNNIKNISLIRLSSQELTKALKKERIFKRLKDINLEDYNFKTVLIDPPRAGVDKETLNLISNIENIIYISCNPITLLRDIKELLKTHKIIKFAIFDQFPYTNHIESGILLSK